MKNKRKICAALMLISFISLCAIAADDEIFTGSCYDSNNYPTEGCVWTLNKTNGTLIFGNSEGVGVGPPIYPGIDDVLKAAIEEGVISDGIEDTVNSPFNSMPNLKKVFLPDTLKSVRSLINNCPQVEELSFDNCSIEALCTRCTGLKTVYLGPTVSRSPIAHSHFNYRANSPEDRVGHNIISINVDEENPTLKSVKGALLTKDGKKLIDFPFGRTSKAVIPYGVEETEKDTFCSCQLTSVTIPDTVIVKQL